MRISRAVGWHSDSRASGACTTRVRGIREQWSGNPGTTVGVFASPRKELATVVIPTSHADSGRIFYWTILLAFVYEVYYYSQVVHATLVVISDLLGKACHVSIAGIVHIRLLSCTLRAACIIEASCNGGMVRRCFQVFV